MSLTHTGTFQEVAPSTDFFMGQESNGLDNDITTTPPPENCLSNPSGTVFRGGSCLGPTDTNGKASMSGASQTTVEVFVKEESNRKLLSTRGTHAFDDCLATSNVAIPTPPSPPIVNSYPVATGPLTTLKKIVHRCRRHRSAGFRRWYIDCFCSEQQVHMIATAQKMFGPPHGVCVRYFQLWSLTGEAEFYILYIPTIVWIGMPLLGMQIASLLCVGQYVTGTMKDFACCPRPPCPPLQMYGKRSTHEQEYGFPSTHSCQSGVFSFVLYTQLVRAFPDHALVCWLVSIFYLLNVSFSRIYLGMHWMGDLIGGWLVAIVTIVLHVAFLNRWEACILERSDTPWWGYVLLYMTLHLLSVAHATPHDPCPCYIDSLRFTGVVIGATVGFWTFYSTYGTLAARPKPNNIFDEFFSLAFLAQWIVCIVIVVVSKEVSSFVAGVALKWIFTFFSGAYAVQLPRSFRPLYLRMATVVGLTTLGNERRREYYLPYTANKASPKMQGDTVHNSPSCVRNTSFSLIDSDAVSSPDGFLNSHQVWSLRTHRHWWLWDVHQRTVSYATTGFVVSFVCQVLLREGFGVGQSSSTPAMHNQ